MGQTHFVPLCLSVCFKAGLAFLPALLPFWCYRRIPGRGAVNPTHTLSWVFWNDQPWNDIVHSGSPWFGIWGPPFSKESFFLHFQTARNNLSLQLQNIDGSAFQCWGFSVSKSNRLERLWISPHPLPRSLSPLYHMLQVWHFWDNSLYQASLTRWEPGGNAPAPTPNITKEI